MMKQSEESEVMIQLHYSTVMVVVVGWGINYSTPTVIVVVVNEEIPQVVQTFVCKRLAY